MAWLRRSALLLAALTVVTAAATALTVPGAQANISCDIGISPGAAVTGAVGIGNPVGDACEAITDPVLGAAEKALDPALDPLKNAAGSIGRGVFNEITDWATDGAVWLLGEVVELSHETTSPDLLGRGFLRQYRQMASIAVVLALAMLIFAALEGLGRGDAGMLWRVFLVNAPVAALATSAAYVVVQLLVATTDGFSEVIAHSTAHDTREFFRGAGKALGGAGGDAGALAGEVSGTGATSGRAAGTVAVPLFVSFTAAILTALAAFTVWIELLMRGAAIYAVALFMPLALAASIWPRWTGALRRTGELIVVVVFSKFVIVAVIALAASLLANTEGEIEHVLTAGALLLLACFSPFVLFRLVPFAEGAVGAAFNRQSAAGAGVQAIHTASSVQMMRRSAQANWAGAGKGGGGSTGGGADGDARTGVDAGKGGAGGTRGGGGGVTGSSGGAEVAAALPLAVAVGVAKAGRAGGERLAGTATAEAAGGSGAGTGPDSPDASPGSPGAGSTGAGAEERAPRPPSAEAAAGGEASTPQPAGPSPRPSEASGGGAPGADEKAPRPSGGSATPGRGPSSPKEKS